MIDSMTLHDARADAEAFILCADEAMCTHAGGSQSDELFLSIAEVMLSIAS